MTVVGALVLLVVFVLAWRGRPLVPRNHAGRVSDRWRRNHFYTDGKQ